MDSFLIEVTTRTIVITWGAVTGLTSWKAFGAWLIPILLVLLRYGIKRKRMGKEMTENLLSLESLIIGGIGYVVLFALVFGFNFFRESYSINRDLKDRILSLETELSKAVKSEVSEEVKVEAEAEQGANYWEVNVAITNIGERDLVLDRANLYCGKSIMGTDKRIQRSWSTKVSETITQYHAEPYRLKPGDKVMDVVNFEDKYGNRLDNTCREKLWVEVFTTLGNGFKANVKNHVKH